MFKDWTACPRGSDTSLETGQRAQGAVTRLWRLDSVHTLNSCLLFFIFVLFLVAKPMGTTYTWNELVLERQKPTCHHVSKYLFQLKNVISVFLFAISCVRSLRVVTASCASRQQQQQIVPCYILDMKRALLKLLFKERETDCPEVLFHVSRCMFVARLPSQGKE